MEASSSTNNIISPDGGCNLNSCVDIELPDPVPEKTVDKLYLATLRGDWSEARLLIYDHPTAVSVSLNNRRETALHIAAAAQHINFVKELVEVMEPEDLALRTELGFRALCFAAISGTVSMARAMVSKNPSLPNVLGFRDCCALGLAVTYRRTDMAKYLLSVTDLNNQLFHKSQKIRLLHATILSDYYDIGLRILKNEPELALERNEDQETALHALARRPQKCTRVKRSEEIEMCEFVCRRFMRKYPRCEDMMEFLNTPSRFLDDAAKVGNAEFLKVIIRLHPSLMIWNLTDNKSIFHIAVQFRQEKVFKLIHEIGGFKDIIAKYLDSGNENMLYLAAKLPAREHLERVSNGAFLQLQREVHWFKEVEKLVAVPSTGVNEKWEMFRGQHKELQKNGEEWMKRTASSCMLVVTLIATVVYTAAFTLPGGNNQDTGVVIFKHKNALQVFLILDTLALMSSTISILIFLSILTSRFTQIDFYESLPRKIFWGLVTLLISIAFMNMAFCTAFFLHYDSYKLWTPWFVSALAIGSFIILFRLEYSLLTEAYVATFSSVFNHRRHNLLWTSSSE